MALDHVVNEFLQKRLTAEFTVDTWLGHYLKHGISSEEAIRPCPGFRCATAWKSSSRRISPAAASA